MTTGIVSLLVVSAILWIALVSALGLASICLHCVIRYITRGQYNGSNAQIPAGAAGRATGLGAIAPGS